MWGAGPRGRSIKWEKRGLIFKPEGRVDWIRTHAWVPTVIALGDGLFRVYFAGRNQDNLSQIGAFTVHIARPTEILDFTEAPLLELGPLGSFDDSAVLPCSVLNHEGRTYLYYVGWMQGKRVPYYPSVAGAISDDGGKTFRKMSRVPLLDRNEVDPFFTASPCVLVENGHWRMWYASYTMWQLLNGQPVPRYHIKYAESNDGIHWDRQGVVAVDFQSEDECAVARPWVLYEEGVYKMWYCYRIKAYRIGSEAYRIGYAESQDGIKWTRMDDHVGIDVSTEGWDSEMIEYPAVVVHNGKHFMFYNGNNYGYDGIGLAVEA